MRYPPPVVFGGGKRLAFHLFFGINVPQTEFYPQVGGVDFGNGALDERGGVKGFPVGKARQFVNRGESLDIAVFRNNAEKAGTFQVGDHDFANPFAVGSGLAAARHLRKSDRHRLAHGTVNVNFQLGANGGNQESERQGSVIYDFHFNTLGF